MATFAELVAQVRTELAEAASVAVVWSDTEIKEAINEGYEEMSDATEWYERMTPVKLLARQVYLDLRGISERYPVLAVTRVFAGLANPGSGFGQVVRWLIPSSVRELDGDALNYPNYPQWEGIMALSRIFFLRGLWWLGLHPGPSADGDTIRIFHSSLPKALVRDEDIPGFPEEFHLALVDYACYEMRMKEKEAGLAMAYWKDYQAGEAELRAAVKNRQSVDQAYQMGEEQPWRAQ